MSYLSPYLGSYISCRLFGKNAVLLDIAPAACPSTKKFAAKMISLFSFQKNLKKAIAKQVSFVYNITVAR